MNDADTDEKPTPPVLPTDSTCLLEHEKTVGTRTLEREQVERVQECDRCGWRVYL